jgi:hypothetical protein
MFKRTTVAARFSDAKFDGVNDLVTCHFQYPPSG